MSLLVLFAQGEGVGGGEIVIYLGKKGIFCLSNVCLNNISIFWKKKSIFLCHIIDGEKKTPPLLITFIHIESQKGKYFTT
jgi:hypothetical protein